MERRTLVFGRDVRLVATWGVIIGAVLAFFVGITVLLLSMRPSHLRIAPGDVLGYRLTSTWTTLTGEGRDQREGQTTQDERRFQLLGVGPDNLVGLIAPDRGGIRFTLLRLGVDGSATRLDGAERPLPGSRAIGLLDLGFFQLPPDGLEQSWDVAVPYGVLPDPRRQIRAKVRRSKSSAHPEFTLKPEAPSIEWLDGGRYRQLGGLTVTYRFHPSKRVVDQATLSATYSEELPPPLTWRRWKVTLVLELTDRLQQDEPAAWHRLALACAAADQALDEPAIGPARRKDLAGELRLAGPGVPQWQALCLSLADAVLRPPTGPARAGWILEAWAGTAERRPQAERLVEGWRREGLEAAVVERGGRLAIELGPFPRQERQAIDRLRVLAPTLTPKWREAP